MLLRTVRARGMVAEPICSVKKGTNCKAAAGARADLSSLGIRFGHSCGSWLSPEGALRAHLHWGHVPRSFRRETAATPPEHFPLTHTQQQASRDLAGQGGGGRHATPVDPFRPRRQLPMTFPVLSITSPKPGDSDGVNATGRPAFGSGAYSSWK